MQLRFRNSPRILNQLLHHHHHLLLLLLLLLLLPLPLPKNKIWHCLATLIPQSLPLPTLGGRLGQCAAAVWQNRIYSATPGYASNVAVFDLNSAKWARTKKQKLATMIVPTRAQSTMLSWSRPIFNFPTREDPLRMKSARFCLVTGY